MPCQCKTDKQKAKCMWYIPESEGLPFHSEGGFGEPNRKVYGCFPYVMGQYMAYIASYVAGAQKATEQMRDEVAGGFQVIAPAMRVVAGMVQMVGSKTDNVRMVK